MIKYNRVNFWFIVLSKIFTGFDRTTKNNADFKEKLGDFGLGLLRISLGETIEVEKISLENSQLKFTTYKYPLLPRVTSLALFCFTLPVSLPLALSGAACTYSSKSHQRIHLLHTNQKPTPLLLSNTEKAAIIIQKYTRGFLARKSFLSSAFLPLYKDAITSIDQNTKKAPEGFTAVYLPELSGLKESIVLKHSGRKDAVSRFHQMQEARKLLTSQNCHHLIIPRARLCGEFLVEEKLPIKGCSYHNLAIYCENSPLFDEAVKEMTRLFAKASISDLISSQPHLRLNILVGDFVRYDNLSLFISYENGTPIGKIGLIDLESFYAVPARESLEDLARIFPLHVEIIKKEALVHSIIFDEDSVNEQGQRGLIYLQQGYQNHISWLKDHKISRSPSLIKLKISEIDLQGFDTNLLGEVIKLNLGKNDLYEYHKVYKKPPNNFLQDQNIKYFSSDLTQFLVEILEYTVHTNNAALRAELSSEDLDNSELVKQRTGKIVLSNEALKNLSLYLNQYGIELKDNNLIFFAKKLLLNLLEHLKERQKICDFYTSPRKFDLIVISY